MFWPLPSEYQSALQYPHFCLLDDTLRSCIPEKDKLGFPKAISGSFAVVFPVYSNSTKWVVRCFSQPQKDRQERYALISKYLKNNPNQYLPDFEYIANGIRINGQSFPIIKMKWIEGELLDSFVKNNLSNPNVLKRLLVSLINLINTLNKSGIAHGDLQHRNILVVNGEIRLIDYDGMFVPGLENYSSCEQGHPNYQSPLRTASSFGKYLDNFSAWVIYLSLLALTIDPNLWSLNANDDECLLLKKSDFLSPELSPALTKLENIKNPELTRALQNFYNILSLSPEDIPMLDPQRTPPKTKPPKSISPEPWLEPFPRPTNSQFTIWGLPEWISGISQTRRIIQQSSPDMVTYSNNDFRNSRLFLIVGILLLLFDVSIFALNYVSPIYPSAFFLIILSSLSFLLYLEYRKSTVFKKKKILKEQIIEVANQIDQSSSSQRLFEQKMSEVRKDEQKEIDKLEVLWNSSSIRAKEKIESLKRTFNEDIINLHNEQRTITFNSEKNKMLSLKSSEMLKAKLKNVLIISAQIPGFGEHFKNLLIRNGIICAADIKDIEIDDIQNVHIIRADRWPIHITGIGPTKAAELVRWKQQIETFWRNQINPTLSQSELSSITNNINNKFLELKVKESTLNNSYLAKIKQITSDCLAEHSALAQRLIWIRKQSAERTEAIKIDLAASKEQENNLKSEHIKKQNELATLNSTQNSHTAFIFRTIIPVSENNYKAISTKITRSKKELSEEIRGIPKFVKDIWAIITGRIKL